MKRSAPSLRDDTPAKRPCISAKYPALRAPPQRRLQREMAKAFQGPVTIGTSRLERLPPEIRNQIYELVLVDKDIPLKIRHQRTSDHGRTTHALTQVSRLIRHESTQMYYWANTFAFRSLQDLEFYLATITPDFRFVKRIELSEGVIEGRHYPYGHRKHAGQPSTRTNFIYKISKNATPTLSISDGDEIHPAMQTLVFGRLRRIAKFMVGKVEDEVVIEGTIAHCELCSEGWQWSCGKTKWWKQ